MGLSLGTRQWRGLKDPSSFLTPNLTQSDSGLPPWELTPQEVPHRAAAWSDFQLERHLGQENQLALSWDQLPHT